MLRVLGLRLKHSRFKSDFMIGDRPTVVVVTARCYGTGFSNTQQFGLLRWRSFSIQADSLNPKPESKIQGSRILRICTGALTSQEARRFCHGRLVMCCIGMLLD